MVMKVMRWPMRHLFSKKYQVNVTLHRLEGPALHSLEDSEVLVDVKWKGPKGALGSRFRGSMKSASGIRGTMHSDGTIVWDQNFEHVCVLSLAKTATSFLPWDVYFVIRQVVASGSKPRRSVLGTVFVNLAAFASPTGNSCQNQKLPVIVTIKGLESEAALFATFSFVELRTTSEGPGSVRSMAPSMLPCMGGPFGWREVGHYDKNGRTKVKGSKENPATLIGRKGTLEEDMTDDGKLSPRSEDSAPESVVVDPFDSDSVEELDDDDYREEDISFVKSFSYGTIAGANLVFEGALPFHRDDVIVDEATGDAISIHSRAASVGIPKASDELVSSDSDQAISQPSMRSLLSWRKRKLSFRSPRSRGEPLLNKAYGEDGGDEIDWDRRMSGSPNDELAIVRRTDDGSAAVGDLDFGEGLFSVGNWERKEVESRDRHLKLSTSVFFASFDQRSESAAGESACTALVAVIADWLHRYPTLTPSKTEFDMLIRDGSAEWRNLCEVDTYKDRFPDRHFDLETVLQAGVRPLCVVAEKSFIGFFKPEGLADSVEFLQGAMTFDGIWEEIERAGPAVYIVSWNDHFFVLKVEENDYYIIDTLGERLYEGCNQAYILQFDNQSSLCELKAEAAAASTPAAPPADGPAAPPSDGPAAAVASDGLAVEAEKEPVKDEIVTAADSEKIGAKLEGDSSDKDTVVAGTNMAEMAYSGKKACCEFVKGFFAALPLRELENDIKRGLLGKLSLHQRLQIEFHYTTPVKSPYMDLISL